MRTGVIIPVYNRVRLIAEALESVANQTCAPFRLVVVDDGSTDGSAAVVERWIQGRRPGFDLRLIRQANAGVSQARNAAAALLGDCELLAFLDSDDVWPVDYLARMTQVLAEDDSRVAASCDRVDHFMASGVRELVPARDFSGPITRRIFRGECPLPSTTVVRAELFQKLNGFKASLRWAEDYDLFLRMSVHGHWAAVEGEPVLRRRSLPAADTANLSNLMDAVDQTDVLPRLLEDFLTEQGPGVVPTRQAGRRLANLYYDGGKRLLRAGFRDQARERFRKALRCCPWHRRTRSRLTRIAVIDLFEQARACVSAGRCPTTAKPRHDHTK